MIIISDCFTSKPDEGCIKVAVSLAKRLKSLENNVTLIAYKQHADFADAYMDLNTLFLNRSLFQKIRKSSDSVLYIPFASNTTGSILRTFMLSRFAPKRVSVIFALRKPMNRLSTWLLRHSGAKIIALSKKSYDYYQMLLGANVSYVKTGVDTKQFTPVSAEQKRQLRLKYDIPENMPVVFHAGHLKSGRNVDKLCDIDSRYYVLLALSSVTQHEQDSSIREHLEQRPHTKIIDTYVEHIEELYQLSDFYVFPVEEEMNCIDVPLSVLEAAACNLPIITTSYGELSEFRGKEGFHFLESVTAKTLEQAFTEAESSSCSSRTAVMKYDWEQSVKQLL